MTTKAEKERTANDLARVFLLGELMSAAMKQLRSIDKPWLRVPEEQQRRIIREVEIDCRAAIDKAVELIASDARTRFRAAVESVTFKDGVKAVLTMANTEASHELADVAGGSVIRELQFRGRCYPRWVADGRMTQAKAEHELAAMGAVLETLEARLAVEVPELPL